MEQMQAKRPGYHFSTPSDWLNDPNGLVWHDGVFHLFYQWCPGIVSDVSMMYWGHAISKDLVHFEHLPPALAPGKLGAVWSGSCVVDRQNTSGLFSGPGGMVAIYTHRTPDDVQRQSIAFSPDGRSWTEYDGMRVISSQTYFSTPERTLSIFGARNSVDADSLKLFLLGESR